MLHTLLSKLFVKQHFVSGMFHILGLSPEENTCMSPNLMELTLEVDMDGGDKCLPWT